MFFTIHVTDCFLSSYLGTVFSHIVSVLELFPPLNSFRCKKNQFIKQLFEFPTMYFQIQKRIAAAETIRGNTVYDHQ